MGPGMGMAPGMGMGMGMNIIPMGMIPVSKITSTKIYILFL